MHATLRVKANKNPCILLNKKLNVNKNETESKIENPSHALRETNIMVQLV